MEFLIQLIYTLTQRHPLHVMFVHFPIGLTGGAAFFMILALWKRSDHLERAAFANIALAAASVVAAGAAGLRDNLLNYGGHAPNVQYKIGLAIFLLILTGATAVVRWRDPDLFHSRRKGLYALAVFASFATAIVLSFLGAVIVYGFGR